MEEHKTWQQTYNLPDPVCLYKWSWTTLYLYQQEASSCHRVEKEKLNINEPLDFHNTPGALAARTKMLNGEWPEKGCQHCRKIEEAGGISDRVAANSFARDHLRFSPPELELNNREVVFRPTQLEVYFNNICNQACLYCFPKYSSKVEALYRQNKIEFWQAMYDPNYVQQGKQNYEKMKQKFWCWMEENARTLKRYSVLGGEPFYQDEIFENIEFFKNHKCPELEVWIFSNFNVDNIRVRKILEELKFLLDNKCVKSIALKLSVDSWGPSEEYVRRGSSNIVWKQNFDMLVEEFSQIHINLLSTLCNLTIKSCKDLALLFTRSGAGRIPGNFHGFSIAGGFPHLDIGIFPRGFFDEDFDSLIDIYRDFPAQRDKLISYKKLANNTPYNPQQILKLKQYLDLVDERRGEMNWKKTFTWLEKFSTKDYTE